MAMSPEHKAALAQGRKESRAIKAYLEALPARKPGRPVTKESLEKRLAVLDGKIEESNDPLQTVELLQKKLDVEDALEQVDDAANFEELEQGFIGNARSYSERKGISYTAWRAFGVPAATVKAAGIPETRRR